MASLNTLFRWAAQPDDGDTHVQNQNRFDRVLLLDAHNLCELLTGPSEHRLVLSDKEGPACGLIPIAGPVDCVHSSGLVWNIGGRRLAWGELVSSSNKVDPLANRIIEVQTSHSVLWTCSIQH